MHQGHIVEEGMTRDIFSSPNDPYTIKLMNSVPKGEPPPKSVSRALLTISNLHCHFPLKKGFFGRKVGEIRAVDDANLTIREGTTYGIVGESGCGKSTFLRCFNRMNDLVDNCRIEGKVELHTHNIYDKGVDVAELRRRVGMVFQKPNPFPKSVYEKVTDTTLVTFEKLVAPITETTEGIGHWLKQKFINMADYERALAQISIREAIEEFKKRTNSSDIGSQIINHPKSFIDAVVEA